ncbi:MAG: hypothetical protein ACRCW2_06375 [Cellulosilyticaceae bacterium]
MKNYLNRVLAGVMVGITAVTMTGCTGSTIGENAAATTDNNQKVPMGRYMEKSVVLPEELTSIIDYISGKDGASYLYGYNQERKPLLYRTKDYQTWEKQDASWLEKLEQEGKMNFKITMGNDQKYYVSYVDAEMKSAIAQVKEDGSLVELSLEGFGEGGMPSEIHVLENGDLLVSSYYGGVTRYSGTDGKRQMEFPGNDGEFTVVSDTQLAIMDIQRGGIVFYDLATGKEEKLVAYDGLEWGTKLIADEQGNTYIINNTGINRLAAGGSSWENIVESGMSSFGKPSLSLASASVVGDKFYVFCYDQVEGGSLLEYAYNPDVASRPTTEVSIYMLEENMTIRQAAAEYQRKNPDVMVRLQVGMKSGEAATKADAIRTLNTELLAGKGPDILMLDGLPIESYRDKGVLWNMEEIIGPMLDKGLLLENIVGAYKEDNGIYAVPTSFELPMMWGDKQLLEEAGSVQDIAAWAKAHPEQKVMYSMTPSMLIKQFYGASASTWLDEKGQINEGEFAKFLEAINTLADNNAAEPVSEDKLYEMSYFSREYMAYKDTALHTEPLGGFTYMTTPYSYINHRDDGDFKVMSNQGKGLFDAAGIIGINANSKNLDIAKGIVETALSETVQNVELGEGFVVNTKAFDRQSDPNQSMGSMVAIGMSPAGGRPIEFVSPDAKAYEQVSQIVKSVSMPAYEDEVLLDMIIEETKGYFDGTKTAEEAASAVAQRTKAYLAE